MSMQIDTGRLTMFRNVDFGNENAIANVNDGKTKLVKNSELGNLFGRLFRSGAPAVMTVCCGSAAEPRGRVLDAT